MFYINLRVLKYRLLAFPRGPGGFSELREAYRNNFHRSWYLSDAVVTSYAQKRWGGVLFTVYGMPYLLLLLIGSGPSKHYIGLYRPI